MENLFARFPHFLLDFSVYSILLLTNHHGILYILIVKLKQAILRIYAKHKTVESFWVGGKQSDGQWYTSHKEKLTNYSGENEQTERQIVNELKNQQTICKNVLNVCKNTL